MKMCLGVVLMWLVSMFALFAVGCDVHSNVPFNAASPAVEALSAVQETEVFVVAPWVAQTAVLEIAREQLHVAGDDDLRFRDALHQAIRAQEHVPSEVFTDVDSVSAGSEAGEGDCILLQHFYVSACRDGSTAWGPCSAASDSASPDWRLLYQQTFRETEQLGQHRVIVALSAEAAAAWLWRSGNMSVAHRFVEGLSECSAAVSSDAVERLFHGNVVAAGLGYSVYQEVCE